jgi:aspartyl-tRNA(Asn)/glutamyl-tRNA(Gln) amidotransferase subunit A
MGPIGMLASRSETLREYFPIISGKDDKDPITAAQPKLRTGRKMRSVAVPKDATDGVSDAVRKAFDDSVGMLKDMSVDVEYVDMPCLRYAVPAHYILHAVEAATNLSRYCGLRYGRQDGDLSLPFNEYFVSIRTKYFGFESKVKAIMGAYMTLGDNRKTFYLRSLGIRKLAIDSYRDILERHDAVLTPSMPFIAPTFDDISEMNSSDVYNAGRFVVPPVFCGLPCISVPCGYSGGMPIGMQLVSGRWNEDVLLSAAEMWEKAFKVRHPEASV